MTANSEARQQILVLHLASRDLSADTVAWALFDGDAGRAGQGATYRVL